MNWEHLVTNIYFQLSVCLLLLLIGVYLWYSGLPNPDYDSLSVLWSKRLRRRIGVVLIFASIAATVFVYIYRPHKIGESQLPSAATCSKCEQYISRSKQLRPFTTGEYSQLTEYAKACNDCKLQCMSLLQAETDQRARVQIGRECAKYTAAAEMAGREQARLRSRMTGAYLGVQKAMGKAISPAVFPSVPQGTF